MINSATQSILVNLKRLRKGRGIFNDRIAELAGPELRKLCGAVQYEPEAIFRRKLRHRTEELAARLPAEMRILALTALGIHEEATGALFEERIAWLTMRLGCSTRTARRRIDAALQRLAEEAAADLDGPALPVTGQDDGWYIESFDTVLRLDRGAPVAVETRRIVCTRDGLTEVVAATSLPRRNTIGRVTPRALDVDVQYGGALRLREHPSDSHFRHVVLLPRPLRAGDRHEYCLTVRVPGPTLFAPHYICVPLRRCDSFVVRVRFNAARIPRQVWRVVGAPPRVIDDRTVSEEMLLPDRFGEVYTEFHTLRQGLGYGVQWEP